MGPLARRLGLLLLGGSLCLGLGLYGWYDYSIAYPAQDAIATQKEAYKSTFDELVKIPAHLVGIERSPTPAGAAAAGLGGEPNRTAPAPAGPIR